MDKWVIVKDVADYLQVSEESISKGSAKGAFN